MREIRQSGSEGGAGVIPLFLPLSALHQQIQDRLEDYEKAIVHQSRKPLGLLPRKAPLSAKNQSSLQTRRLGQNQGRRKSFSP